MSTRSKDGVPTARAFRNRDEVCPTVEKIRDGGGCLGIVTGCPSLQSTEWEGETAGDSENKLNLERAGCREENKGEQRGFRGEVAQEIRVKAQQGKGDKVRRSKEAAASVLREITMQLRIKGESAPFGGSREEVSWQDCSLKGKGVGRKDGREGTDGGDSSEHVVWSRVRGKSKGFSKLMEALMAEGRMETAVIEQRKKGLDSGIRAQ